MILERMDHSGEDVVFAGLHNELVEFVSRFGDQSQIGAVAGVQPPQLGPQFTNCGRISEISRLPGRGAFQNPPDLVHIADAPDIERRHKSPHARADFDETFTLEPQQRFANWCAAETQVVSQPVCGNRFTGLQFVRNDLRLDELVGPVCQRSRKSRAGLCGAL